MAKSLDDLIAESEIRDLHLHFCRANDRLDEQLMRSCFHPDAVIELHQPYDVDSFIAFGKVILSQFIVTRHTCPNQLVEVDGDVAWAEHYTTSSHRIAADDNGPERDMIAFGRYIDRVERRDGEWRIARRTYVLDYNRLDPVPDASLGLGSTGGARDRSDPSYALHPND
ncbi:MAG: nuclear transport factor 2 family protein [Novosphingobium sp.]|nr:nuclear transport factor 2 family protein [Novosphingobium sp.]